MDYPTGAINSNKIKGRCDRMLKKIAISTAVLGLVIASSAIMSEAQEPLYDKDGNLILDVEQEAYQDLSTTQPDGTEVEVEEEQTAVPEIQLDPGSQQMQIQSVEPKLNTQATGSVAPRVAATETVTTTATEPEIALGTMSPASATYMAGSTTTVKTEGTLKISKVEVEYDIGLTPGSWSLNKSNNTISFDKAKLDSSTTGIYTLNITFENGSTTLFEIRVLGESILEDYWQQNIKTFSKDPRSNTNKDLELISSNPFLTIQGITIDGLAIPASKYSVVNGTIIISKNFLASLESTDRARISVTYFGKRVVDFSLEITDQVETGTSVETVDC